MNGRSQMGRVIYDVFAIAVCLVFLTPVLWAVLSAFQPPRSLFVFPPNFDPRGFTLENFRSVFATGDVPQYALNSLIVATSSSLITAVASSMAGFALAKYRFLGRQVIFMVIISVLLIPLQV